MPEDPIDRNHYAVAEITCRHCQMVHPVECIEVLEYLELAEGISFLRANAIKYLVRAGRKGDQEGRLTDLRKARWYIDREIARVSGARPAEQG